MFTLFFSFTSSVPIMTKSLHLFISLFLLLLYVLSLQSHSLSHEVDDCSLLLDFKNNISTNKSASSDPGSYPKLASWSHNTSEGIKSYCCSWDGVECSDKTLGHVIVLDLSSSFLYGHINSTTTLFSLIHLRRLKLADNDFRSSQVPSAIGNLIHLEQLDVSDCSFLGTLPGSISNLTHLTDLSLGYNEFTGKLPSLESLSNLTYLSLSSNNFDRWKLPGWVGKLNKLTYLSLIAVNLSGEIPSSIFKNLTQLEYLNLLSNRIEGRIPAFPSTMTELTSLNLAHNQLRGPIPSSLSDLENLQVIFLNHNNISGTVEVDVFLSLKKLRALSLGGNRITLSAPISNRTTDTLPKLEILKLESCNLRVFPDFLRFQDQLQELNLKLNHIDGLIPEWMANTSKETLRILRLSQNSLTGFEHRSRVVPWIGLRVLDLSDNMLQGSIPVPPPTTTNFLVSNNNLTGEIPPSVCDLRSLQVLDLSFNNITGSVTPCLEKLKDSLLVLNLRGNTLRGTIPDTFKNGSKLLMINLSENQLSGRLPRSLENCASLQILNVGNNRIEDTFPFWLGQLSELQVLLLKSNKFHGAISIPNKTNSKFPKLRIIDLSYNSFSGDLPHEYFQEWSGMKEMESDARYMHTRIEMSDANNYWWRDYSYSMKLINKGVNMEYERIINIFIAVDLSSNKFSGKIPESLASLSSLRLLNVSNNEISGVIPSFMANLTLLESLDLSRNKLSGKMPGELAQLNFLAVLNVSYNNLTGHIPRGTQFNTFPNTSYIGNLALCGDPLSKKCGNSETSKPPAVSLDEDAELDFPSGVDWVVILSGVGSGLVIGLLFGNHLTKRFYMWVMKRYIK